MEIAFKDFTAAVETATQGLPDNQSLLPPKDGITLLDAKNEIFLAYLQALALRNLSVIRSVREGNDAADAQKLNEKITKKLVEHRVYLERGVKPLEQRIKYQVDKVVKAADDEERQAEQKARQAAQANGKAANGADVEEGDDSDASAVDELAYRPNTASMLQSGADNQETDRKSKMKEDGVYRPPRIAAAAMPSADRRERSERKPARSSTLDEYVNNELSAAPVAQPSIGSTITAGGRRDKSDKQRREEKERQEYEETNLVRLPEAGKKDKNKRGDKDRGSGFGGEEWRGLDQSLDRIGSLTKKKGKDSALDKSRKRKLVEDGQRNDGTAFDIQKQRMLKKSRR